METMSFNKTPLADSEFGNPMYGQVTRRKQLAAEQEGRFRDSVKASGSVGHYSGRWTRSAFIESIRLD